MKVRLQSYPDLDAVTRVETGEQPITVVLEVPQYFAKERWEVTVWHSTDENEWCALDLQLLAGEQSPVDLQADLPNLARLSFQGALSFKKSIKFTIKFRHGNNQPWVWVRDEYGLGDGHIVSSTAASARQASDIVDLIPNLNKEWTVTSLLSQSPETKLWSLEADIPASKNDTSAYRDLDIGTPFGALHKYDRPCTKLDVDSTDSRGIKIDILTFTGGLHWYETLTHGLHRARGHHNCRLIRTP